MKHLTSFKPATINPHLALISISICALFIGHTLSAALNLTSSSSNWTEISYPGVTSDFYSDEQANSVESDIVGNASHGSIFTNFWDGDTAQEVSSTDGTLAFRVRLAGEKNPSGFSNVLWIGLAFTGVGNQTTNDIDVFLGYDEGTNTVGVYSPGTGSNTSPSTTSVNTTPVYSATATALSFNWSEVTTIDPGSPANLDGGTKGGRNNNDFFASFSIDFGSLVSATQTITGSTINELTNFGVIAATSTQVNSLNQDLNGVDGGTSSSITWDNLGAISTTINSTGTVVPEPATYAFILSTLLITFTLFRRKR